MSTEQVKTVVVEMTEEEMREYQALKAKREADEAERLRREERGAYRDMAMKLVDEIFPEIKGMNESLRAGKQRVSDSFSALIESKRELFAESLKDGQRSHTFINADSTKRIIVGRYMQDAWDDTVEQGINKVKQYISSLVKDSDSQVLVDMLLDLLSKDKQGNLKADKVLQLMKHAEDCDDPLFREGVQIIQEAYRPVLTKTYIRAEERDGRGSQWRNVPLNITEA